MIKSVNQPWAISNKYQTKYGPVWSGLDFIMEDKISAENFKTDPMNCTIGQLHVNGQRIYMKYKDLILYAKEIEGIADNLYSIKLAVDETFNVEIKGRTFNMKKHEIGRLSQTINDALHISLRSYELGLYL